MKNLIYYLFVFCLVYSLPACKKKVENKFGNKLGDIGAKANPIKVEGQLIEYGDFPIELVSNGKLEAFQKASLKFRNSEKVVKINYQNGAWVEKGSLIAELDNQMESLDLEQAKLRMEKVKLDRLDLIVSHQVGAKRPEDVSPASLNTFNIKVGFKETELAYQQALIRYEYTRLVAPVSGRIASLECKEQNFPAGDKPFCLIINDKEFEVVFPVMENEIARLRVGQEVTVKPFAMDSVTYIGRIAQINPLIDEHGNVTIKARVPNTNGHLVEGMNVKALIRDKVPGGLIVPKEAVVLRNNQQVVFSLLNGRSYWNYVESDLENSSSYTIRVVKAGILKAGDTIITKGNLNLANDAELEFKFNAK
ncbi:MAG: efflux RND transporter periplasmic adaptor subunit [Porphyromonadaceae bacterium]|nr:MAG: efflux RND transporter periplasmic adaptor subunit [Porphyromonadaceae bacterium]